MFSCTDSKKQSGTCQVLRGLCTHEVSTCTTYTRTHTYVHTYIHTHIHAHTNTHNMRVRTGVMSAYRWKDSQEVVHVQLSERAFRGYEEKLTSVINACETRVKWLKSGSREVFGTILEEKVYAYMYSLRPITCVHVDREKVVSVCMGRRYREHEEKKKDFYFLLQLFLFPSLPSQVVLVIDTSSSLRDRLDVIKDKLHQLIREQLSHKQGFTVLQFSSKVTAWREHLVPTSEQNLEAVWQWVQGLRAEGSTNTLGALTQALAVRGAEAVYLLTDGRPDQPCDSVLARVQQLPSLPVHTISFNCADSRANYFLARLASNTGGR